MREHAVRRYRFAGTLVRKSIVGQVYRYLRVASALRNPMPEEIILDGNGEVIHDGASSQRRKWTSWKNGDWLRIPASLSRENTSSCFGNSLHVPAFPGFHLKRKNLETTAISPWTAVPQRAP